MADQTLSPATRPAKIAELKRELEMRRTVYPAQIDRGTLARWRANRQIFVLRCILDDYEGDKAINGEHFQRWRCPLCAIKNITPAGESVGYCDATDGCESGPFYLQQAPKARTQGRQIDRRALLIQGIEYPYQNQLFNEEA